ncbi:MAG: hypothetical protein ACLPN6_05255 [Streptosporangiaceae bacterium]
MTSRSQRAMAVAAALTPVLALSACSSSPALVAAASRKLDAICPGAAA